MKALTMIVVAAETCKEMLLISMSFDTPRHHSTHPTFLLQGQELRALQARHDYPRIIYCGDGANDLCPALTLRPSDVLLARKGFTLDKLAEQHMPNSGAARTIQAKVLRWQTHEELFRLARQEA